MCRTKNACWVFWVKTEEVGSEVILAKMQAFCMCRGWVCCTCRHITIPSLLYMVLWRKELLTQCGMRGKNTIWLCCFSPMYQGKTFLQRYWHTAPLSESLGNPYSALSHMPHSAFGKTVGLDEVVQKFSVVTAFLKFLFPRNWKDLGSSGSFSCKWKIAPYS